MREGDRHNDRQEFRSEADSDRHGKDEGVEDPSSKVCIHSKDHEHHDERCTDNEHAEVLEIAVKTCLFFCAGKPCCDLAEFCMFSCMDNLSRCKPRHYARPHKNSSRLTKCGHVHGKISVRCAFFNGERFTG